MAELLSGGGIFGYMINLQKYIKHSYLFQNAVLLQKAQGRQCHPYCPSVLYFKVKLVLFMSLLIPVDEVSALSLGTRSCPLFALRPGIDHGRADCFSMVWHLQLSDFIISKSAEVSSFCMH